MTSKSLRKLLFASALLLPAVPGFSAAVVWTGGAAQPSWNDTTNWGGNPLPNDIARFATGGITTDLAITLDGSSTLNQLHWNGPTSPFTITGGNITLNGSGAAKTGLLRNTSATGTQTLSSGITLNDSLEFNIAGTNGSIVLGGVIGEAGGARGFTKIGSRALEVLGNNTFTGAVSVLQNNLIVGHNNALGTGTSPIRVGRTDTTSTNQAYLLTKSNVIFSRDVIVRSGATGDVRLGGQDGQTNTDWNGTIYLERDIELNAQNTGSSGVRIVGNIVDATSALAIDGSNQFVSSNVTKVGNGRLKLSGDNTYSGTTTVSAGALFINGTLSTSDSVVTVVDRLGGKGTINRPVSVASAGTLVPGDVGIGKLTIGGGKTLSLADGASLNFEFGATPANSDKIAADVVAFAASLKVNLIQNTGTANSADTFTLLSWTGADPVSLPNLVLDPTSEYTGNLFFTDAADGLPGGSLQATGLTVVTAPEPTAVALLSATGLLLLRRRRR